MELNLITKTLALLLLGFIGQAQIPSLSLVIQFG